MRSKSDKKTRRGVAFLMLVVMLLLVVIGAARGLVVGEVRSRQSESASLRAKTLQTAIDKALSWNIEQDETFRLPVGGATDEQIEISRSNDEIRARWLAGDVALDQANRQIETTNADSEP